jgi:glycosyltransferase involved in cell wall biosynthesis
MLKVSIITPSLNQARYIGRTLQSVIIQTGAAIEHVVIDGGSEDNTVQILKEFGPSVHWVSEKDNGQANAVNKGISATDGEIIGWLNSDDMYYAGAVAKVVELFHARPDIDVVYGGADHIDTNDLAFEAYPTEAWDFERLKEICFISQPATFFRRRVFEKYGALDESLNYCMDYEYWLRLGKAGVRFHYLEQKLAGSRLYVGNKTLGSRMEVHNEINDMLKSKFGAVSNRWLRGYANVAAQARVDINKHPYCFSLCKGLFFIYAVCRWNGGWPF